jgi:hypothetical protein
MISSMLRNERRLYAVWSGCLSKHSGGRGSHVVAGLDGLHTCAGRQGGLLSARSCWPGARGAEADCGCTR